MTKPTKWDLKTIIFLCAFFGVTSVGTLISQAQRLTGWLAGPAITSAQDKGLAKWDSLQAPRMDTLKTLIKEQGRDQQAAYDDLKATLAEVPAIQEAAKRRKARQKSLEALQMRRTIADNRIIIF